jgi:hypothetical protein
MTWRANGVVLGVVLIGHRVAFHIGIELALIFKGVSSGGTACSDHFTQGGEHVAMVWSSQPHHATQASAVIEKRKQDLRCLVP